MKSVSVELAAHIASGVTTLATCCKVTRQDGTILGFTDHDQDLVITGVTYFARTGYVRSAFSAPSDLSVPNTEFAGVLDSSGLDEADFRAGVYDFASVRFFVVNWANLTQGSLPLPGHHLGEVTLTDHGFKVEILGLADLLKRTILRIYTPDCDADLGDARCTANISLLIDTGTVTGVSVATRTFTADITGSRASGWFNAGLLHWTAGANIATPPREVKSDSLLGDPSRQFVFYLPVIHPIAVGDTFWVTPGCDKTAATCKAKFANLDNFRGYPFVPGLDLALQTPSTSG